MTTRRKVIEIVGAAAASVAFPEITGLNGPATTWARRSTTWSCLFENRSFDNLLGRLYAPGEVKSFEGVIGKDLKNPIPEWAEQGAERKFVPLRRVAHDEHAATGSWRGVSAHQHGSVRNAGPEEPFHAAGAHGGAVQRAE